MFAYRNGSLTFQALPPSLTENARRPPELPLTLGNRSFSLGVYVRRLAALGIRALDLLPFSSSKVFPKPAPLVGLRPRFCMVFYGEWGSLPVYGAFSESLSTLQLIVLGGQVPRIPGAGSDLAGKH